MQYELLCVGEFAVNCAVIDCDGGCVVVDPGSDAADILSTIGTRTLKAVLLTHAHFDHIGAIPALQAKFPDCRVYLHPSDSVMIGHPLNCYEPEYPLAKFGGISDIREQDYFQVIETPGHTPGSVSLMRDGVLFSGDTLFAESVGRTDLPGGNADALMRSLAVLKGLPPDLKVIPGHGMSAKMAAIVRQNPFMQ